MNLTRCAQGHFYDADTNETCPHCQSGGNEMTVPVSKLVTEDAVTKPLSSHEKTADKDLKFQTVTPDDDSKTISLNRVRPDKDPVVGWLVCVEGAHLGEDFRLKAGKNFIGRSPSMDVALTNDKSVSRDKHAIILYEPKTHIFLVQPGESRELCYLNNQVILAAQEIKRNDVISLGESKVMFFACCDDVFNWNKAEEKEDK